MGGQGGKGRGSGAMAGLPIPKQSKLVCESIDHSFNCVVIFLLKLDEKYLTSKHLLQNLRVNIKIICNYSLVLDNFMYLLLIFILFRVTIWQLVILIH